MYYPRTKVLTTTAEYLICSIRLNEKSATIRYKDGSGATKQEIVKRSDIVEIVRYTN